MSILKKIFNTENPIIGMIHFMPLLGYKDYRGMDKILKKALKDLEALEKGGVNGIMLENNYDMPHKIFVDPETTACMTYLAKEIINKTKLPVGILVLWNDYRSALSIAKICAGKFVRVPVFVDDVRTSYGDIFGKPDEVVSYRKKIGADDIAIFTDIHVKHATLLSKKTLSQSAQEAIFKGSDALVVTGRWTADVPKMECLREVREKAKYFPILVGSGADKGNIRVLRQYADGVIVGTSIKTGKNQKRNVNIREHKEYIELKKVKEFVKEFRKGVKK